MEEAHEMRKKSGSRKIGLALGGGAARGFAHIGVLKVLEEQSVRVHCVAGTSAGSLIGSLFCAGLSWRELSELARDINWRDLVSPTWPTLGVVNPDKLEKTLNRVLQGRTFGELSIPFRAVAVDIETGEEVVLASGSVARAVRASCSIPGIFEPTEIAGRLLVDGGLLNNVPTDVLKEMGAEVLIGVDLNADRLTRHRPENLLEVFYRSLHILIHNGAQKARRVADIMVEPPLEGFAYHDLSRSDQLIERGERAMAAQMPKLRGRLVAGLVSV
jgi:NTE family protein